MVNRWAK
jgi:hypothetical protein